MKNSSNQTSQNQHPSHDQIAAKAYQLYLEDDSRPGNDLQHWLRAEELLSQSGDESTAPHDHQTPSTQSTSSHLLQPLDEQNHPQARGARGSASRDEIRQISVPPAARQSQRRPERSHSAR